MRVKRKKATVSETRRGLSYASKTKARGDLTARERDHNAPAARVQRLEDAVHVGRPSRVLLQEEYLHNLLHVLVDEAPRDTARAVGLQDSGQGGHSSLVTDRRLG